MSAANGERDRRRLGVLGGTFDPPHVGHAIAAQDVVEALRLDRLLVIPAGDPPHREPVLPAEVRYELVRDLLRGTRGVEVSDLELRRSGPSYTVDTLEELRRASPRAELFCVIGADQLRVIGTWHEFRRLPDLARIVVMTREGVATPGTAGEPFPYTEVEVTRVDVSSTRIRERLREGRSIRHLVPEPIRDRVERAWREFAGNERRRGAY